LFVELGALSVMELISFALVVSVAMQTSNVSPTLALSVPVACVVVIEAGEIPSLPPALPILIAFAAVAGR
jgi:hypothetical protein